VITLPDGTQIQVWFSPNMKERVKPKQNAATPPDMAKVFQAMHGAKRMILMAAFYPGFPSIISELETIRNSRPDLMIKGAVSSAQALPKSGVLVYHRKGQPPILIPATALEQTMGPFHKELLKAGPDAHAIIHYKLEVIDPTSKTDCVVIITSHNLGFKASYSNDENMLIIKGNRSLALSVAVRILEVYDHYLFRNMVAQHQSNFSGFLSTKSDWQNKYLHGPAREELEYWTSMSL
jgi:phosphatidylserine/phosphatidylglycerophosphate/cardiolipin synthase-like enzyme